MSSIQLAAFDSDEMVNIYVRGFNHMTSAQRITANVTHELLCISPVPYLPSY